MVSKGCTWCSFPAVNNERGSAACLQSKYLISHPDWSPRLPYYIHCVERKCAPWCNRCVRLEEYFRVPVPCSSSTICISCRIIIITTMIGIDYYVRGLFILHFHVKNTLWLLNNKVVVGTFETRRCLHLMNVPSWFNDGCTNILWQVPTTITGKK